MSLIYAEQYPQQSGFGAAPSCPAPTRFVSGRGCCLQPNQQAKGNLQCCKSGNVRKVNKIGNKYSLSCGSGGGPSPGDGPGATGSFRIQAVAGGVATADRNLAMPACRGGKAAELRRPGVSGLGEFGGMVERVEGSKIYHGPGTPSPKVGDTFIIYCAGQGGSSSGGSGGGILESGLFSSGDGTFPWGTVLVIGGIGFVLYMVAKKK